MTWKVGEFNHRVKYLVRMGEPISRGKAASLQPSPVKTAPGRPRRPAGRGPADTAGRSQGQAPDGGQSGAATGTQAALLRQRPDVSLIVMAVGGEDVLRQTAQQELGVVFHEHQRPCLQPAAGRQNGRPTLCRGQGGVSLVRSAEPRRSPRCGYPPAPRKREAPWSQRICRR